MYNNFSYPLFKENMRRFWPLILIGFLGYFFSTVTVVLTNSSDLQRLALNLYHSLYGFDGFTLLVDLLLPVASALAVMSFTHRTSSFAMLHTLPVKRRSLFITSAASGLVLIILPLLANSVLLVMLSRNVPAQPILERFLHASDLTEDSNLFSLGVIWAWTWKNLFVMLYTYVVALLAGSLAGNLFFHGLLTVSLNFVQLAIHGVILYYCKHYLFGFAGLQYGFFSPLWSATPWLQLIAEASDSGTHLFGFASYTLEKFGSLTASSVLMHAVLGLLILAAAYLAFQKRQPEKSGDSLAVSLLEAPLCVLAALAGMTLLPILLTESYGRPSMQLAGALFGLLVCQILLKRTWRVFTAETLKRLAASAVVCLLFTSIFSLDLTGFEKRAANLESAETINRFSVELNDGWSPSAASIVFWGDTKDMPQEMTDAVTAFHKSVADHKTELTAVPEIDGLTVEFQLVTTDKKGSQFIRYYQLPYEFVRDNPDLKTIYESGGYEKFRLTNWDGQNFADFTVSAEPGARIFSDLLSAWTREHRLEALLELKECIVKDIQNRSFAERMALQEYHGGVTFNYSGIDPDTGGTMYTSWTFYLDNSFTCTLNWLEKYGYSYLFPTVFEQPLYAFVEEYDFRESDERQLIDIAEAYGIGSRGLIHLRDSMLLKDAADAGLPEAPPLSDFTGSVVADPEALSVLKKNSELLPVNFGHYYRISFVYKVEDGVEYQNEPRESSTALIYRYIRPDGMPAVVTGIM